MAAEPDLEHAAVTAADHLYTLWLANTLKTALTTFWGSLIGAGAADKFPQDNANNHPVSNWLILIAALAKGMPASNVSYTDLDTAINYVYRVCWMTNQLDVQGLISSAQATAVLTAYNANF